MVLLKMSEGRFPTKHGFVASAVSAITPAMQSYIAHGVTLSHAVFINSLIPEKVLDYLAKAVHRVQKCGGQGLETEKSSRPKEVEMGHISS